MEFSELQSLLRRHRNIVLFVAFVVLVAGLDLILNPPERDRIEILALPFIVAAIFLLATLLWPLPGKKIEVERKETLAGRFLNKVTLNGKFVPYSPIAGIVLIALDVAYNAFLAPSPTLQIHDTVAILFGVSLVMYPLVPERFDRERDFVLLFFFVLVMILVVPLLLVRLYQGNFEGGVDAYSSVMLAPELRAMLGLIGIPASVSQDPWGSTAPALQFVTQQGQPVWVVISTSCSGIYSFSIFASAFTAFILTEFNKTNWRVWTLLALGFVAAYFANLLRMTVIVAVGYFSNSTEEALNAMLIAHSNAGWLIFLGWISLFWLLMYRFLFPKKEKRVAEPRSLAACSLCNEPLSPTIRGAKCECGSLFHYSCIKESGQCPSCHRLVLKPGIDGEPQT